MLVPRGNAVGEHVSAADKEIFMQYQQSFNMYFLVLIIGWLLVGSWTQARANGLDQTKPMVLRKIMKGMGKP